MDLDDAGSLLAALAAGPSPSSATAAGRLAEMALGGELRDFEWDCDDELRSSLQAALLKGWSSDSAPDVSAALDSCVEALLRSTPEFDAGARAAVFDARVADCAIEALYVRSSAALHDSICIAYAIDDSGFGRSRIRASLGGFLAACIKDPPQSRQGLAALDGVLQTVSTIIHGMKTPLSSADEHLLAKLIIPLHGMPGKVSPSESALGEIHRSLTNCVLAFLDLGQDSTENSESITDANLKDIVIQGLAEFWPSAWEGNSPKEVLLLHELEAVLRAGKSLGVSEASSRAIGRKLGEAVASDNSTVCERALMYWKHEDTVEKLYALDEAAVRPVAGALFANALTHWNHTVAKLAPLVLASLNDYSRDMVLEAASRNVQKEFTDQAELETYVDAFLEVAQETKQREDEAKASKRKSSSSTKDGSTSSVADEDKAQIPAKRDVSFMNMIVGRELGHGSFSQVFHAQQAVKGKPSKEWPEFAIKRMQERHRDIALREAEMMDAVNHPLCTRLVGLYESAGNINLVMEYAASGDLHTALATIGTLDEDTTRFIAGEVATALNAVHEAGLIFSDLKPENVLIHANGHVKLGDFGATRPIEQVAQASMPLEGTLAYLAPELFRRRDGPMTSDTDDVLEVPEAIDWWAFGCVVYQMLAGRPPLWVEDEREAAKSLISFEIERYPEGFPETAQVLVDALLTHDPEQRLCTKGGMSDLENHEFFAPLGMSFEDLHEHPAPKFVVGKVKQENGPWTQRSYSMMHAPLPEVYATGASSSTSIVVDIPEADQERNSPWRASGLMAKRRSRQLPPVGEAQNSGMMMPSAPYAASASFGGVPPASSRSGVPTSSFMSVMPGMLGRGGAGAGAALHGRGRGRGSRGGSESGGRGNRFMFKGLDLSAG